MPEKHIDVPGMGIVAFPDTMSDDDIAAVLRKQVPSQSTSAPHGIGKTGTRLKSPKGERDESLLDWFPHMGEHFEKPSLDTYLGVTSDLARYLGMAASPSAVGPVLAHPGAALVGGAVGLPVQQGVEALGEATGYPGAGAAVGDIAGVGAGWGANKLLNMLPTGVLQALWDSPSLRGKVVRKIPGLKTALDIKDVVQAHMNPEPTPVKAPGKAEQVQINRQLDPYNNPPGNYVPPVPSQSGPAPAGVSLRPKESGVRPQQAEAPPPSSYVPPIAPNRNLLQFKPAPPDVPITPRDRSMFPSGIGMDFDVSPVKAPPVKGKPKVSGAQAPVVTDPIAALPSAPAVPQGSTIIPPVEGKPGRYGEMVQTGGTVLADYGTNIDAQIAKHLKSKGYTPETVMGMDEDALYNAAKIGVPTLRKFGTSGKASRPFAIRQRDIFDALSKEWGR